MGERESSMRERLVVQIVPRRSDRPDGVADYATILAEALYANHGIRTVFLVGTPATFEVPKVDGWRAETVSGRSASALSRDLDRIFPTHCAAAVLLHYSAYGYQKRGCPVWLAKGLTHWRRQEQRPNLLTMFHELDTAGPLPFPKRPWHSSFWLQPLQSRLCRHILDLSDGVVTTTQRWAQRLQHWSRNCRPIVQPVFSNVGEPTQRCSVMARDNVLSIFGGAGVGYSVYGRHFSELETLVRCLGIREIWDIGPRSHSPTATVAGIIVKSYGVLPANKVSVLLNASRFGLVDYPLHTIEKSAVHAALAAHGVVPILLRENSSRVQSVYQALGNFPDSSDLKNLVLDGIQGYNLEKYTSYHSVQQAAQIFARLIAPSEEAVPSTPSVPAASCGT